MGFRFGSQKRVVLAREDWILLALATARRNLNSVQLQKLLCLLGRQFPQLTAEPFYRFPPDLSERFPAEVHRDVNLLAMVGQLAIEVSDGGGRDYHLAQPGLERARDLESRADPEAIGFLRRTAAWVRTRSVDQLINGPAEPTTAAPPPKTLPLGRR